MSSEMQSDDPFLLKIRQWMNSHKHYEARKAALTGLLSELGFQRVRNACNAGHRDRFEKLIDEWKDPT